MLEKNMHELKTRIEGNKCTHFFLTFFLFALFPKMTSDMNDAFEML